MNKLKDLKILEWDIETLPHLAACWGMWQQNLSGSQIFQQSSILCISYKWLGSKDVINISPINEPGFALNPYGFESWITKAFIPILETCDFSVAHNGDKFDYSKLKAASVMHKLDPFKVRKVDTLKMAKTAGLFPKGNKLDNLANVLGIKQKHKTSMDMWMDIALRKPNMMKQMQKMIDYCNQDVRVLEEVFLRLWPHSESILPNVHVLSGGSKIDVACDRCASQNVIKKGLHIKNVLIYQRYKCKSCGAAFLSRSALDVKGG